MFEDGDENQNKKQTKTKTKALTEKQILERASVGLSHSQSYTGSDIEQKRVAGLRLYNREPFPGDKRIEGRSTYVTSDTFDNTEWLLANLMALFDSQDRVVQYVPSGPEDEALAEQQTDVVNFVVTQSNNHALVLHDWLKNG